MLICLLGLGHHLTRGLLDGTENSGSKASLKVVVAKERRQPRKQQMRQINKLQMRQKRARKKMIRGKRKCKGCGELGHGETSYKCHLNGTKKRKRKPRKNTTKYGENAKIPTKRAKKGGKSQDTATEPAAPNAFHDQEIAPPAPDDLHALEIEVPAPDASLHDQEMPTPAPNTLTSPTRLTRDQIIQNSPNRVTRGQLQNLLAEGVSPDKTVQKRSPPKKLKPRKLKTN